MIKRVEFRDPADAAGLPESITWLLPRSGHPYYIVTPRYARTSAGIKVLHFLCNALNRLGERAYIVTHPFHPAATATNPDLNTPILTKEMLERDFQTGLTPIVVYPETVTGNPLNAPFVVRYIMNFPGLLGGEGAYDPSEFCVAYSEILAQTVPDCRMTIFFPASDPMTFSPYPKVKRKGSCFYAAKYRYVHQGELFDITKNSIEITRDRPNSQTPDQIAELFRSSEVFYTYENTALAIEATLCGCPVVFLPNKYLDKSIGLYEVGTEGVAWGTSDGELERAKRTVHLARERYLALFVGLKRQLQDFVAQTQQAVNRHDYKTALSVPQCLDPNMLIRLGQNFQNLRLVTRDIGVLKTLRIIVKKLNGYFFGY